MNNQKVLIFGAKGWIGGQVHEVLKTMIPEQNIFSSQLHADDIHKIKKQLDLFGNITHVMCFIGRTHGVYNGEQINTIDYLEKPGKIIENVRDNLFAPISLALLCKERNIHFTYLGTGCIFDYDEQHPCGKEENGFTEEDIPNFIGSSYSIVKGFTDQLMHLLDSMALNIRIRMPITSDLNDRNFIMKITKYHKICSIPNSMTVLDELIPIMIDLSFKNTTGTFNFTNPGVITHNEILQMYKEIIDPDFTWKNFTIEEQNQILLSKRSNNFLDTKKLEQFYPQVQHIKESVKNILTKMKDNIISSTQK